MSTKQFTQHKVIHWCVLLCTGALETLLFWARSRGFSWCLNTLFLPPIKKFSALGVCLQSFPWGWGSGRDSTFDPLPACCSNFSLGGNQPLYSQKFKLTPKGRFLLIEKAFTDCSSKSFWAREKVQQVKVFATEPGDQNSVPTTHIKVEGEKWRHRAVLWLLVYPPPHIKNYNKNF